MLEQRIEAELDAEAKRKDDEIQKKATTPIRENRNMLSEKETGKSSTSESTISSNEESTD